MTKKDYIKIAKVFAETLHCPGMDPYSGITQLTSREVWESLRAGINTVLTDDNPRYDRSRFYAATEGRK